MLEEDAHCRNCTFAQSNWAKWFSGIYNRKMSTRRSVVWAALALPACIAWSADSLPPASTTPVDFARDVEPLLRARCALCHGEKQQMKGLRLDLKASAMSVVNPGHSAESKLIRMVAGLEGKMVMPP